MPPKPSPHKGPRWPLYVVLGAALLGGVYLSIKQFTIEPDSPSTTTPRTAAIGGSDGGPAAHSHSDAVTPISTPLASAAQDKEWVLRLRSAELRVRMEGFPLSAELQQLLQNGQIAQAAAVLESSSAGGDRDATAALARIAYNCGLQGTGGEAVAGAADLERAARDRRTIPAETQRRITVAQTLSHQIDREWRSGCDAARLNTAVIDQRLRAAAAEGHETSLWWLGNLAVGEPETARKYWLSAAMLGHRQAQTALGESYWQDNLRGEHRERSRMAFWLNAASNYSPRAQSMLGQCRLTGCDGQPADPAAAVPLLLQSAKAGDRTAMQLLLSAGAEDASGSPVESEFAWKSYLEKLNDQGCYGAAQYPSIAVQSIQRLQELSNALTPFALQQAQQLAEQRWREYGPAALTALGCG